jgi:hypothetical protein
MSKRLRGLQVGALGCALAVGFMTSDGLAQGRNFGMIDAKQVTPKKEAAPKFATLLETKDLSHFRGYKTEEIPDGWQLEGKALTFGGKGNDDIITKETFTDFELQVEWSIEKGGNSGIMFRVTLGDDAPYYSGPEFQILDDDNAGDGKSELTSAGALYGLYPATEKKLSPVGKWNKSRIIVNGNKFTHFLNGVKVVDVEADSDDWNERLAKSKFKDWEKFNKSNEGHIAFQNHGSPVKFRNIRIKRLGGDEAADASAGEPPVTEMQNEQPEGIPGIPGRGIRGNVQAPPSKGGRRN